MRRVVKQHELGEAPRQWVPSAREPLSSGAAAPRGPSGVSGLNATAAGPAASLKANLSALEREAREEGLARGIAAAEEAYRAKVAKVDALATSLKAERAEFFDRIEPELVRLSVSIAEKVIGQELEMRPEIVVEMVRSAIKRLRDRESLRVSVNPRDVERVKEAREDLISTVDGVRKMEIVEDRRVDAGGCMIESPNGTLDARIKTQIGEISRVLGDMLPKDRDEHGDPGP